MAKRGRPRKLIATRVDITPEQLDQWADEIIAGRDPQRGGKRERKKIKPGMLENRGDRS